MERVLGDLAACGYDAEWQCISAASIGAPHVRERVFIVSYATSRTRELQQSEWQDLRDKPAINGKTGHTAKLADADRQGLAVGQVFGSYARQELPPSKRSHSTGTGQWAVEPSIRRVVNGFPHRVDRLRGLGNAVVPQVAQFIGECILQAVEAESEGVA